MVGGKNVLTMDHKYQWQGEPVQVEFGYCVEYTNKDKPMFWYNYECEQLPGKGQAIIPAVRVLTKEGSFVLSNHHGIGVKKLLAGGWPNERHYSLTDAGFVRSSSEEYRITEFDGKGFTVHELKREKWQATVHPKEYRKLKQLELMFITKEENNEL